MTVVLRLVSSCSCCRFALAFSVPTKETLSFSLLCVGTIWCGVSSPKPNRIHQQYKPIRSGSPENFLLTFRFLNQIFQLVRRSFRRIFCICQRQDGHDLIVLSVDVHFLFHIQIPASVCCGVDFDFLFYGIISFTCASPALPRV